jgi:uncharacterized repeat protein (TIGR01451 family)
MELASCFLDCLLAARLALISALVLGVLAPVASADDSGDCEACPQESLQVSVSPGGGCTADLVFLLDTSESMCNEWADLCAVLGRVVTLLNNSSYSMNHYVVGLRARPSCDGPIGCVDEIWSTQSRENWGPAVEHWSESYPWRPGAIRIIVPISDEGPYRGCPINASDDQSISGAINAANANGVVVFPLLGNVTDNQECGKDDQRSLIQIMDDLAAGTGGARFNITGESDLAQAIVRIVHQGCCELEISKRSTSPVSAGSELTYVIDVYNNCTKEKKNVTVIDLLDDNISYISGGSDDPGVEFSYDVPSRTASWHIPVVGPQSATELSLNVLVSESVPSGTEIVNRAVIAESNKSDQVTDLAAIPGIDVEKIDEPSIAEPGQEVRSTITVTNTGGYLLDTVYLVDALPEGLSYLSDDSGGNASGGVVFWSEIGPLEKGQSRVVHLNARASSGASGLLTDPALAIGQWGGDYPVSDTDFAYVRIREAPAPSDSGGQSHVNLGMANAGRQIAESLGSGEARNARTINEASS